MAGSTEKGRKVTERIAKHLPWHDSGLGLCGRPHTLRVCAMVLVGKGMEMGPNGAG
jgi:hypothetical protein